MCRGADAINYGLDTASGDWWVTLGDDDELMPNFMESLLTAADHQDLDMVYGRSEIVGPNGSGYLGDGRPMCGSQTNIMLCKPCPVRQDPTCYLKGLPGDWMLMRDIIDYGFRWGWVPDVVHRYYPSTNVPGFSLE
jgi:glycosyltransferase involved in cell wall biosynthesis